MDIPVKNIYNMTEKEIYEYILKSGAICILSDITISDPDIKSKLVSKFGWEVNKYNGDLSKRSHITDEVNEYNMPMIEYADETAQMDALTKDKEYENNLLTMKNPAVSVQITAALSKDFITQNLPHPINREVQIALMKKRASYIQYFDQSNIDSEIENLWIASIETEYANMINDIGTKTDILFHTEDILNPDAVYKVNFSHVSTIVKNDIIELLISSINIIVANKIRNGFMDMQVYLYELKYLFLTNKILYSELTDVNKQRLHSIVE